MLTLAPRSYRKLESFEGPSPLSDDQKWAAVISRDESFNGAFVFAVQSTGIYCRPSCPAKHPHRDKVAFFIDPELAEQSGYQPCKRCKPRKTDTPLGTELIDRVCKYLDANADKPVTLSTLGANFGLSQYHLQRIFKRALGISPRQYMEARRLERMKRLLKNGETVNNALYDAGFSSRSRVYEKTPFRFGGRPGHLRRGGEGMQIEYTIVDSPIGRVLLASTKLGMCAVCQGDSDAEVEARLSEDYPLASLRRNDEGMREWAVRLTNYFAGRPLSNLLPVDVQATAFQWRVWESIRSIPYGSTSTYGKIAQELGIPKGARAVARACATNPVSLIIPCHRVVGKEGGLRGYRWGNRRKQTLLAREGVASNETATPTVS
jgi:AraC family transcriptional regulator of adaptative response/methylated-DNA-[protein]-cysteine methyltransferase